MQADDLLNFSNLKYLETLHDSYVNNPGGLTGPWRDYLATLRAGSARNGDSLSASEANAADQERLDRMVWAFRAWGHLGANVDPLGLRGVGESFWGDLHPTRQLVELAPESHGLSEDALDRVFTSPLRHRTGGGTLRDILRELQQTYCGSIGYEFMHVQDLDIRTWFLQHIEQVEPPEFDSRVRSRIAEQLIRADAFEQFVRRTFPGSKVFSIDGSESLIPLLDLVLHRAAAHGTRHVIIGMAHRGRLNVLTNVFGILPGDMFRSFADRLPQGPRGHGDVRYHLGDEAEWRSAAGESLQLSLCFNPSHLEFVNPVAMGRVRGLQDQEPSKSVAMSMVVLIHGDASFAAEGIVYESINLSRLPPYDTGGVVHIVVNNQIGFTTTPAENRTSTYATDVARALQLPVLHVNGEDMAAVHRAASLAMEFRRQFARDVVIDLVSFRRWGHNETDEPTFTQPRLYAAIHRHRRLREQYIEQQLATNAISAANVAEWERRCQEMLRQQYDLATGDQVDVDPRENTRIDAFQKDCRGGLEPDEEPDTGVGAEILARLLADLSAVPAGFHLHPKLQRSLDERRQMAAGDVPLDWAAAEALAFASLAHQGHSVRLVGQDTQRGTFSHRHAILHDVENGTTHNIFSPMAQHGARVEIINTPLCEAAAMGFEYGYSLERPDVLVAWEAQFGDFVNVAQVIVDQFLASAEDKWNQLNSLVLLLPHGFEGQGPEHSSARLERFLTLTSEDNLQVVQPSTPAQYFHVLRRQVLRRWCKPLIVLTPKSLLRLRQSRSPLSDFSTGRFQRAIGNSSEFGKVSGNVEGVSRILLCSGKLYYELLDVQAKEERDDIRVVRIEQFFPLADATLRAALGSPPAGTPVVWVQEEPENMGAWHYWRIRYGAELWGVYPFSGIARPPSASPATGSKLRHREEQQRLLQRAFADDDAEPSFSLTNRQAVS